jgi:hypothetical protein
MTLSRRKAITKTNAAESGNAPQPSDHTAARAARAPLQFSLLKTLIPRPLAGTRFLSLSTTSRRQSSFKEDGAPAPQRRR